MCVYVCAFCADWLLGVTQIICCGGGYMGVKVVGWLGLNNCMHFWFYCCFFMEITEPTYSAQWKSTSLTLITKKMVHYLSQLKFIAKAKFLSTKESISFESAAISQHINHKNSYSEQKMDLWVAQNVKNFCS